MPDASVWALATVQYLAKPARGAHLIFATKPRLRSHSTQLISYQLNAPNATAMNTIRPGCTEFAAMITPAKLPNNSAILSSSSHSPPGPYQTAHTKSYHNHQTGGQSQAETPLPDRRPLGTSLASPTPAVRKACTSATTCLRPAEHTRQHSHSRHTQAHCNTHIISSKNTSIPCTSAPASSLGGLRVGIMQQSARTGHRGGQRLRTHMRAAGGRRPYTAARPSPCGSRPECPT